MAAKTIKISKSLSLPLEAVTQTFAILAKKGAGKSHTASVMAEEMMSAGEQCIILDPTGAWWGLKSAADGKTEGFPIVVFGGDHGDVPLNESSGEIIAQAIIEKGFSAILDFSLMRKTQMRTFVTSFLETLYRINRETIHVFIDEADLFAPQKMAPDVLRLLGAMEDLVLRGRKRGIGCTMITQRSARINKDILTQCEILIALRISHPIDINTIMEWVNVHADKAQAKIMVESLPSLPIGTAWFWSPGWINVFQKIEIRKRNTFDSGATPKPGQIIKAPKRLAKIDIKMLGESIEQIVEQKKSEDPRELRKQIAELKKQLEKLLTDKKISPTIDKLHKDLVSENASLRKEMARLEPIRLHYAEVISNLHREIDLYEHLSHNIVHLIEERKTGAKKVKIPKLSETIIAPALRTKTIEQILNPERITLLPGKYKPATISFPAQLDKAAVEHLQSSSNGTLGKCERAILSVLAQQEKPATKRKLGILTGYSSGSGSFSNALSNLKSKGYINKNSDAISITPEGNGQVIKIEPLPDPGEPIQTYWINKLPKAESAILQALIHSYPGSLTKEHLGNKTGYSSGSGSFSNAISKLRTLELIDGKQEIKAADDLFE